MTHKSPSRSVLFALGLFAMYCPIACAQAGLGTISGTVLDGRGAPEPNVVVGVIPAGTALLYSPARTETDVQGNFFINHLEWGRYRVFAMKPATGYPSTDYSSFYGNGPSPQVTISSTTPSAKVRIRLGPKAGILVGVVRDANTGAPVRANFKLTRAELPDEWLSTSQPSSYRVLLPPGRKVLLQVSAPGYKTWTPRGPFNLRSGEETQLDIFLQPSYNPNTPVSEFLIPSGYSGWVQLDCDVKGAPATPTEKRVRIFKFPTNGILVTSSDIPAQDSEKRFLYYTARGALEDVLERYRAGRGLVWGQSYGFIRGKMREFYFFVGTKEQYEIRGYRGLSSAKEP